MTTSSQYAQLASNTVGRRLLALRQAAARLSVHPSAVRALVRDRRLPAYRLEPLRTLFIPVAAIDAFIRGARSGGEK